MIYIMRHGLTEWNASRKMQGRTDIPLSEAGREMARKAAKEYKRVDFDICFCSPLCRAKETAELLLDGREVEIITDSRLTEMCFGVYEGTAYSPDNTESPIYQFFNSPESYSGVESGETFDELFSRTGAFLKEAVMPRIEKGENVLIVAHGAVNSSIICRLKNRELKYFWKDGIENCKLMKLG